MSGPLYDGNLYYEPEDINKEVETLARIMCPLLEVNFNSAPQKEWNYSSCCECLLESECDGCTVIDNAQCAIKAGYGKTSKIAKEIFAEMRSTAKCAIGLLKHEKNTVLRMAKMECYQDLIGYIDMLEKKYTEEGK